MEKSKKLSVKFLNCKSDSPLVLPAGIMDVSYGSMLFAVQNGAGFVTMKSCTLEPRSGHAGPVVCEIEGAMINAMGLCNPGIEKGLEEIEKFKKESDVPVISSVFGANRDEFVKLSNYVNDSSADYIELNLSCPNVSSEFGTPLSASKEMVADIVGAVKKNSRLPVLAKLSPNTHDVTGIARAAENAGADGLVMINTLGPGMVIDINARRPVISAKFGGISGPAVKPVAVKLVYQVTEAVGIPVIGMGGVTTGSDAIEMIMAGASLVGVGTAVYYRGIEVFNRINSEIVEYLDKVGLDSVTGIKRID
ncbi:MAG: dihydroorotate dehydrogenase [Spirochaetes bacterium]|nr:dihydroorotate dehydrogenase [Spirochaetota bacterium]MBN2769843.1 dihydroorotate dehydrogenase [Spirochaetota bacterium]